MSYTNTNSNSSTWSEARANHVMGKVYENLMGLKSRGLITIQRANQIREQILYLLSKQVLNFFELQFINSSGVKIGGLHYKVFPTGVISDEDSKDENYWRLSNDIRVCLLVDLDENSSNIKEVNNKLKEWGFGIGSPLEGVEEELRTYSKDGYGLKQIKIGDW